MNVRLLIPTYSGRVHYTVMQAAMHAAAEGAITSICVVPACSVLPLARARLVADFDDRVDAALMLDDDTLLRPDDLSRMVDSWTKLKQLDPGAVALSASVSWRHGQGEPCALVRYRTPEAEEACNHGYYCVRNVGLGALIVDGEALRAMIWEAPTVTYSGHTYPDLFPFETHDGLFFGEDYVFTRTLSRHGRIYVDEALNFGHAERW